MSGEPDLQVLLSNMDPQLSEGEFVFCSLSAEEFGQLESLPIATFQESEGLSTILRRQDADRQRLAYSFVASMIKLNVHSSLNAVGFVAAIASRLAQAGISVNPVSAYFHDYLFVPAHRADEAMRSLRALMDASN